MWVLRSPQIEILTDVAWSQTKEELERFIESERVDEYKDGNWYKTFRKDGPLEWYNEPYESFSESHFIRMMTTEELVFNYNKHLDEMKENLFEVSWAQDQSSFVN